MFELVLDGLPEMARAARRLYDPESGGYHLPPRDEQKPFGLADLPRLLAQPTPPQYDCIEVPVADLLCSLVLNTRSRLILETGTSRGFSTSHLAAAARCVHGDAAQVISLDPAEVPNRFYLGSEAARSIQPRRVDSLTQDPRELAQGGEFDFLFLDSLHTYEHLGREIALFLPQLKLGGLMMLHDTFFYDGLGLTTLMLMQTPGLEVLSFPTHRRHARRLRSPGVSLFRKLAPVAPGSIVFPGELEMLRTELVSLKDPRAALPRLGMAALRPHYVAASLAQGEARGPRSAALLEPAGAPAVEAPPAVAAVPAPAMPEPAAAVPSSQAAVLRCRAYQASASGQVDRAITLLQQALQDDPHNAEVLCDLAALALATGDVLAAVKLARATLERSPDHPVALYTLGMGLAQGGAAAPAIRALERVATGDGAAALRAQTGALADNVVPMLEKLRQLQAA